MSIQTIGFRFNGIAPLLMHNGALANPLNPLVKEMKAITGLRKKTDEHHLELQRLEFRASLYLDAKGRVIVPSSNIEGTLVEGAKKAKLGKAFKSAVMVADDAVLDYGAQLTIDELWDRLHEVQPPVCTIHGLADIASSFEFGLRTPLGVQDPRTVTLIPHGPHAVNVSDPKRVNKAIVGFIEELAAENPAIKENA